jgi:hypothetical protein
MSNSIKKSLTTESKSMKKGEIFVSLEGKGPTSLTGFTNGIEPSPGGYTIYLSRPEGGFSIYAPSSDSSLIYFTNLIDRTTTRTTKEQCFAYFNSQTDKILVNKTMNIQAADGLVLNLDSSYLLSYPATGSTWNDVSSNGNNTILVGGISYILQGSVYGGTGSGSFDLDGTDDYINFTASNLGTLTTVEMWCRIGNAYSNNMIMGWGSYTIWCGSGGIGFNTGNSDVYGISQATVNSLGIVNEWAHYIFEFNSNISYTNNRIYINGVAQSLSQQAGTENTTNRTFNSGAGRIAGRRADLLYLMPMRLSIFRVYNRRLTSSEISTNYLVGKARYQNFFTNGNFKFLDTTARLINYTSASVSSSTVLESYSYSLRMPQLFQSTYLSDSFVEVDTSKTYRMTARNRTLIQGGSGSNVLSGGHLGFSCYDSSFRFIDLRNCGGLANTFLTRDLFAGDQYAYISNQNNQWTAADQSISFRHFCLYPPKHPEFGTRWTYTRIGQGDFNIYYNEITDIGGGELRVRFANASNQTITFPNIGYDTPAGTGVMNGVAGGTYNYVFYPATGAFGTWSTHVSSPFTGQSRNSGTPFRFGTKYVKFLHLINYAVSNGVSPLPIMLFGDITLEQLN